MERLVLFRPGQRGASRARIVVAVLLVAAVAAHFVLGSYLSVDLFIIPILIGCVVFRSQGLVVLPLATIGYAVASWLSGDLPFRFIFLNSLGQLLEWSLLAGFVLVTLDRYALVKRLESRMFQDLDLARRLQSSLIQPEYDYGTVRIRGFVQQSHDVGGDFYYFRPFMQKYVVFCLGDVMGKGISASLLMAMVMGFMFEWGKKSTSPRFILNKLNSRLVRQWGSSEHAFLTTFYAVYCEENRELTYSAAGHHGALLVRSDGQVESLGVEGIPLGVFEDAEFLDATVTLEVGDRVILFTDGVTEARDPDGELFGVEGLQEIVLAYRKQDSKRLLEAIEAGGETPHSGPTDRRHGRDGDGNQAALPRRPDCAAGAGRRRGMKLSETYRLDLDYGPALQLVRNCDLASYLAVLMRVGRVGDLSVQERNLAVPIAHDLQARESETLEALQLAESSASLEELVQRLEHPSVRLCLYRDACRMALADGLVDEPESKMLEQLAVALGLDRPTSATLLDDLVLMRVCQERFRARLG